MHQIVSKDERFLYSVGVKEKIVKWDIQARTFLAEVPKKEYGSLRVAFAQTTNILYSSGQDNIIHAWDGNTLLEKF